MMMFNNACRTCHTIRDGDNRLAPNLYGLIGRKSGTARGYSNYSSSMKNVNIVWDEKNLEQFIADPGAVVSGNNIVAPQALQSLRNFTIFARISGDAIPENGFIVSGSSHVQPTLIFPVCCDEVPCLARDRYKSGALPPPRRPRRM
jgi:hypothetical protein